MTKFILLFLVFTYSLTSNASFTCITDDLNHDTKVYLEASENHPKVFSISINIEGEMVKPLVEAEGLITDDEIDFVFLDNRGTLKGEGFFGIYPIVYLDIPEHNIFALHLSCVID